MNRYKTFIVVERGGIEFDIKSWTRRDDLSQIMTGISMRDISVGESGFVQIIEVLSDRLVEVMFLQNLHQILGFTDAQFRAVSIMPRFHELHPMLFTTSMQQ